MSELNEHINGKPHSVRADDLESVYKEAYDETSEKCRSLNDADDKRFTEAAGEAEADALRSYVMITINGRIHLLMPLICKQIS